MPQQLITFNAADNAPILHMAVANGFVPETYMPLLTHFTPYYRVVCLPPRALWQDAPEPPLPYTPDTPDWRQVADDLLAGMEMYDLCDVVAVGHSFGGVASALAVIQQPERFKALILLDPTFLPESIVDVIRAFKKAGMQDQNPLAQTALRRTAWFQSQQEAFERFRSRKLFEQWSDEALWLYVQHGTRPAPDNNGFVLRWSPAWEAFYFSTGYTETWHMLPKLNGLVPTLIIQGETTDTYVDESAERVRQIIPSATHWQLPGHGHLFPQSAPDQTAAKILAWLEAEKLLPNQIETTH